MNRARSRGVVYVDKVFSNVSQEIIEITTDRLTLILTQYVRRMETHASWRTPLAILVTIVLALCTTDAKSFLGLSADVWRALFIFGAVVALGWFLRSVWRCRRCPTIEEIVEQMKKPS